MDSSLNANIFAIVRTLSGRPGVLRIDSSEGGGRKQDQTKMTTWRMDARFSLQVLFSTAQSSENCDYTLSDFGNMADTCLNLIQIKFKIKNLLI